MDRLKVAADPEDAASESGNESTTAPSVAPSSDVAPSTSMPNDESLLVGVREFTFRSKTHFFRNAAQIQKFYEKGLFCDVCVHCGDKRIKAHRVVLSASSDYFAAMFTNNMNEAQCSEIEIFSIDPAALETLINYCYFGEIFMAESSVEVLLSGACLLQLSEVVDACSRFLSYQLHPSNCLGIRSFADAHGCQKLLQQAEEYCTDHFPEVMKQHEFLLLSMDEVSVLLSSDSLNVANEQNVYQALLTWLKFDIPQRRKFVGHLLLSVRLPLLPPDFIMDQIENHPLFENDRACQKVLLEAYKYLLLPHRRTLLNPEINARPRKSTVGSIYCLGGTDANKGALSIECYNFLKDQWKVVGSMTGRRLQVGVALFNDKIYVVGGRNGLKTLNVVECWDYYHNKWVDAPPMNVARHGLGVAVLEAVLYAIGGHDGWSYLSSAERFDGKSWTNIAEMSTARNSCGVAVCNGRIYAVGGRDGSHCHRSVECYNPHTNKWTLCAEMMKRRGSVGVGVLNDCIYAIGGMDTPFGNFPSKRFECVERYDTKSDTWTMIASLAVGRDGIGVCPLGSYIFAIGGYSGTRYESLVEYYDPETNEWHKAGSLNTGRTGSCVNVRGRAEDDQ